MTQTTNNAEALREPDGAHGAYTLNGQGGRTIAQIEAALQAKLDPKYVKTREQGGTVSYIEGWHAISEMNRIFGHMQWDRVTDSMREVCRYENAKGNHVVGYEAQVTVKIYIDGSGFVSRQGTGYGSGIARDLFSAIESAGKEAETDAMKRAMMTLGNPMGLALYDKKQVNVGEPEKPPAPEKPVLTVEQRAAKAREAIAGCTTSEKLTKITSSENYRKLLEDTDGTQAKDDLMNFVTQRFGELMPPEIVGQQYTAA